MNKLLKKRPLTAQTGVRFPLGVPIISTTSIKSIDLQIDMTSICGKHARALFEMPDVSSIPSQRRLMK